MLREKYQQFMLENSPQYYNEDYKTYKLKSKLEKEFGNQLQFWQPNYRSELVYSSVVPKGRAVESAFEIAASDSMRLEAAALCLRRIIYSAQQEAKPMPWPPSANFLLSDTISPPPYLEDFVSVLITGKKKQESSGKTERLAKSFSQDLCQAASRGQWLMPKHLLLGMTLRHLTGSAEVITLIHRFGHCASYSCMLELETAMCKDIDERETILPLSVRPDRNIVTHLCWDNFDLNEATPFGAGTTHTAHGLIIQEVSEDSADAMDEIPAALPRMKDRSVTCRSTELEPCFAKSKCEPNLAIMSTEAPSIEAGVMSSDMLWICSRAVATHSAQTQPSWAGWVSLTASKTEDSSQESTVEYMPPVFAPITESSTVQHILRISQEASKQVGQQYTIVTFDLAVAKKAYAIVWQNPQEFGNIIIRMGAFHLTCAYMCALGKSLRCSGFQELLIESGICASGSIEKVMTGKHYNRALLIHKHVLDALERLLLQSFESSETDSLDEEARAQLLCLSRDPSQERLSEALVNESCQKLLSSMSCFRARVRHGELGKTAQFWLSYMDRVWHILQFQRATKENNLALHLASLENMCSLFFSYDHQNYARYTAVYLQTLLNLPTSHPGAEKLLQQKGFSVDRSAVPSSRNAVDITIEQTINRHAKSHGGIVGFIRSHAAYYRWCTTRHARGRYHQAALEMTEMDSQDYSSHKGLRSSQIAKSDEDTKKVMQAISNFINSFDVDTKDVLYCLSSGAPAPKDIEEDLLNADKAGTEAYRAFVEERLVAKAKSFNAPIKKLNLKTFSKTAQTAKVSGKAKKSKQVTAERNVFCQLVLLALDRHISLESVLRFPMGPVPWALATADGILPKQTSRN